MTVQDAHSAIAARLEGAGVEGARAEASALLGALLGLSRTELWLERARVLSPAEAARLEAWLERRARREPLQHITGRAPFWGLELTVGPAVLVPRPETERLVELVLDDLRGVPAPKVLDVGTGSGAVALALKLERPDALVLASDLSEAALEVARANAIRHGLELAFARSDLLLGDEVRSFARAADAIVANLPYLPEGDRARVPPEVRHDPEIALYAGADGLALYRRLERQAAELLEPGARLWLELDPRNLRQAEREARGWGGAETFTDLAGRERFLRLLRGR